MKSNKVVAFSLLAHINDNAVGIKDFDDIFQPLIKTALCKLNTEGVKSGSSLSEIKSKVDEIFALDIPIPYLKKLLEKIAKETLAIEEVNLTIHQDGSFLIDNFIFEDFEIQIAETEDDISEINKLYEVFLETEGLKLSQELSIFEYLDKSRLRLSKFFAYKQAKLLELDDVHQANFINSLRNKPKLFNALRRIYLGSIISAYLITDFGEVKRDLELLLDTNFIIGLLDLNSIESTHTCNKIIELAKKLGFRVSVLPYTLEETELLIERKANQLSKSFFQGYLDPESILNAAIRKGYTKTQLIQIGANLRQTLENQFGVDVIGNDEKFKNLAKFQYRKILEFYQELRGRFGWSAHHDTTAIAYVKEKRGRRRVTGNFMNAKCWFVTNTPYDVKTPKTDGLPEVIRAGELLSLL